MIKLFSATKEMSYELEEKVNAHIQEQRTAGKTVTVSAFGGDYVTQICVFSTDAGGTLEGGVQTKPEGFTG